MYYDRAPKGLSWIISTKYSHDMNAFSLFIELQFSFWKTFSLSLEFYFVKKYEMLKIINVYNLADLLL